MKNYIVHDSNGLILRVGLCEDNMMQFQHESHEFIMEGKAGVKTHKILDGKIEEKKSPEYHLLADDDYDIVLDFIYIRS